jgi:hypothetical protein
MRRWRRGYSTLAVIPEQIGGWRSTFLVPLARESHACDVSACFDEILATRDVSPRVGARERGGVSCTCWVGVSACSFDMATSPVDVRRWGGGGEVFFNARGAGMHWRSGRVANL